MRIAWHLPITAPGRDYELYYTDLVSGLPSVRIERHLSNLVPWAWDNLPKTTPWKILTSGKLLVTYTP